MASLFDAEYKTYLVLHQVLSYRGAENIGPIVDEDVFQQAMAKTGYYFVAASRPVNDRCGRPAAWLCFALVAFSTPSTGRTLFLRQLIKAALRLRGKTKTPGGPEQNRLDIVISTESKAKRDDSGPQRGTPSADSDKSLELFAAEIAGGTIAPFRIRCLNHSLFFIDITKHVLASRHEIVPAAEAKALLAREGLLGSKGMIIRARDPWAIYLDADPGMLIRIERPSEATGIAIVYRTCV